jgi:hypothetical protein
LLVIVKQYRNQNWVQSYVLNRIRAIKKTPNAKAARQQESQVLFTSEENIFHMLISLFAGAAGINGELALVV